MGSVKYALNELMVAGAENQEKTTVPKPSPSTIRYNITSRICFFYVLPASLLYKEKNGKLEGFRSKKLCQTILEANRCN